MVVDGCPVGIAPGSRNVPPKTVSPAPGVNGVPAGGVAVPAGVLAGGVVGVAPAAGVPPAAGVSAKNLLFNAAIRASELAIIASRCIAVIPG